MCLAEYVVRRATRNDLPAVRALIHTVHINPTGLDWSRFLVAAGPEGNLIGCGQIKPHADGSRELASIAVQEQARGQSVARAVIEALLDLQPERPLFLICRSRLGPFYIKWGFHAIVQEEMPTYFRNISRVERIFNSKAQPEDRLLVMRLD